MGALTPNFLFDLESRMRVVIENEFSRLLTNSWWKKVATTRNSESKRELITFLLSTANIERVGTGQVNYLDIEAAYTELVNDFAGAGLRLKEEQFDDLDGNGIQLAAKWASDIGALMGYWPQQEVARFLKTAHTDFIGYDKLAFFHAAHLTNPNNAALGTYANLFTGASSGDYPGAVPIHEIGSGAVPADVALQNLAKLQAYVAGFKMPNGITPRMLRLKGLIVPPKMFPRAVQLTNAKFIVQAGGASGAGSSDVEALVKNLGFAEPIQADELAGYENETTYFAVCEQVQSTEVGGVIYQERKPFKVNFYSGNDGANVELARSGEYEWICKGRNAVGAGHPYLLLKCKGA